MNAIESRKAMVAALRAELVGPSLKGLPEGVDPAHEVLRRDPPARRYGVGVIYSANFSERGGGSTEEVSEGTPSNEQNTEARAELVSAETQEKLEGVRGRLRGADAEEVELDLSTANEFKPSSMAVSFLAEFEPGAELIVEVPSTRHDNSAVHVNGRYRADRQTVDGKTETVWVRTPISLSASFTADDLNKPGAHLVAPAAEPQSQNLDGINLRVEVFSRPYSEGRRLVTVCLINRTEAAGRDGVDCLFQAYFRVSVRTPEGIPAILPYPEAPTGIPLDEEEKSLALLYREFETFGVGHGCAADWGGLKAGRADWVTAEVLPEVEVPSITSDVVLPDGKRLEVSMGELAGLIEGRDGMTALREVVKQYEDWIERMTTSIAALPSELRPAGERHMTLCKQAADRMRRGIRFLELDPKARQAFAWANEAMLLQQLRGVLPLRAWRYDESEERQFFEPSYPSVDILNPGSKRGRWRAFQIAFLMMTLASVAGWEAREVTGSEAELEQEAVAKEREAVELIWFPTGGGKTEAYLGAAAFGILYRRLRKPSESGTDVLMRYTLRLLTAQQFQRAAGLILALEAIRKREQGRGEFSLGTVPFSIGLWLGASNTPNSREEAVKKLEELKARGKGDVVNPFVLLRCPWCGAQMGPVEPTLGAPKQGARRFPPRGARRGAVKHPTVVGYNVGAGRRVAFQCPDSRCEFHGEMPIYVVDEDLYEFRPTMVIGTVDKFAMLTWDSRPRSLFGIGVDGTRFAPPPNLIIQDELHLIAGPLGSMVGLYETLVEELCTDRRGPVPIRPKIISSTATIRRYANQIHALYARKDARLFPPPGLTAADSFFACYAKDLTTNKLLPGRRYVGVFAPGLGSMQTVQVRSFSALLQEAVELDPTERDPWWSLLLFFNSLRELGTTVTLFQSDIPDYLVTVKRRRGLEKEQIRKLEHVLELTGRTRGDEVPKAIAALQVRAGSRDAVDVGLASNIIEVGVDIDRLSLMAVVGQPKSTAQYIQVTGRVGRDWMERPGLVATLYGASKSRDRSHFEKFKTYHQRLYAQVEPTSVTPFSPPVMDRALHAVMAGYVRQLGDSDQQKSPYPAPLSMLDELEQLLLPRVQAIDPDELDRFRSVFRKRRQEWSKWQATDWHVWGYSNNGDKPLLRPAGTYVEPTIAQYSWPTPTSMRNVDAECQAQITRRYSALGGEEHD